MRRYVPFHFHDHLSTPFALNLSSFILLISLLLPAIAFLFPFVETCWASLLLLVTYLFICFTLILPNFFSFSSSFGFIPRREWNYKNHRPVEWVSAGDCDSYHSLICAHIRLFWSFRGQKLSSWDFQTYTEHSAKEYCFMMLKYTHILLVIGGNYNFYFLTVNLKFWIFHNC